MKYVIACMLLTASLNASITEFLGNRISERLDIVLDEDFQFLTERERFYLLGETSAYLNILMLLDCEPSFPQTPEPPKGMNGPEQPKAMDW